MAIVGNRICRRNRAAGRVQPSVCDRRGHPHCTHSLDRVFHHALLVRIYAISRMGEFILARLRPASSRASTFVLGLFVYYLLAIIPFIGWLVVPLVMLFGFGAELIARKQLYTTARTQGLI